MRTAILLACVFLIAHSISIKDQLELTSESEMHDLTRKEYYCFRAMIHKFMKWTCQFDEEEDPQAAMM